MEIPTLKESAFGPHVDGADSPVFVTFITRMSKPASEQLATIIDLAESFEGVITFAIVNVEESAGLADRFGILSVPTSVLFNGGKVSDRIVGLMSKTALIDRLDEDLRSLV
jgi:thioredoxin 1